MVFYIVRLFNIIIQDSRRKINILLLQETNHEKKIIQSGFAAYLAHLHRIPLSWNVLWVPNAEQRIFLCLSHADELFYFRRLYEKSIGYPALHWEESREHRPALIGLGCSVACLLLFGVDNFILPAMALIILCFTLDRKKSRKEAVKWLHCKAL